MKFIILFATGTCKIEKNCTATIKATKDVTGGGVDVDVCYTHYGHAKNIGHIWISQNKRQEVAAKLAKGITREKILDDIRSSVQGSDHTSFMKHHMIGKEDIKNIRNAFGLHDFQRHTNDQTSLLSWIEQWGQSESNPVLFFKLQGEAPSLAPSFGYEELKREDFLLVIQTPFQKHMTERFAQNGVCVDSTHGTTGYDFYLTTLLVIDEFGAGFPVAFCLATHEDETFQNIFFKDVKRNLGKEMNPAWFMSDSATQFYNAFVAVNKTRPKYLVCSWHVEKNWRENLRAKIKDTEIQSDIYKRMRILLEEPEVREFENKLALFRDQIARTPALAGFNDYFTDEWVSRKEQWAFSYRQHAGINCNMYLERFHQHFKYGYLGGKANKRADK